MLTLSMQILGCSSWILRHFRILLSVIFAIFALEVKSQSYSAGYNEYVQGNFLGAEGAFKAALARNPSTGEKARIYKMLGISQYMQGKRIAAEESFKQAKKLNPNLTISPSEVLDESVIDFYNSVKGPSPTFPLNSLPAPPARQTSRRPQTYLQVFANVKDAIVYIDGRPAGKTGALIVAPPGIHEIIVAAKGYQSLSQPVNIKAYYTNRMNVELISTTPETEETDQVNRDERRDKEEPDAKAEADNVAKSRQRKTKAAVRQDPRSSTHTKKVQRKRRRRVVRSYPAEVSAYWYFLPFGAGQYANESWFLGSTFTVLQGAGIIWYLERWYRANTMVDRTNNYINKRTTEEEALLPDTDKDAFHTVTVETVAANEKKIAKVRREGSLGLVFFAALWGASILEAFASGPEDQPTRHRKSARYYRYEKTASGRHAQKRKSPDSQLDDFVTSPPITFRWNVQPILMQDRTSMVTREGFLVDLRLNF